MSVFSFEGGKEIDIPEEIVARIEKTNGEGRIAYQDIQRICGHKVGLDDIVSWLDILLEREDVHEVEVTTRHLIIKKEAL